jgi:hypothetical protein
MVAPVTERGSYDAAWSDLGAPATNGTTRTPHNGWTMIAGLLGVGVAGASWAWRTFLV